MLNITVAAFSEKGGRENNEDSILWKKNDSQYCIALADGLGGHFGGEIASRLVCNQAIDSLEKSGGYKKNLFDDIYMRCQQSLLDEQDAHKITSGLLSTLNLLYIDGDTAYWSHVGDSRTYYFEDETIIKRTRDHSVSQMLVLAGEIEEADIRYHEDRSKLLKALGTRNGAGKYDEEKPIALKAGDKFLLCSDGLWEHVTELEMEATLKESTAPDEWLKRLFELAEVNANNPHRDNASAIAVFVTA